MLFDVSVDCVIVDAEDGIRGIGRLRGVGDGYKIHLMNERRNLCSCR